MGRKALIMTLVGVCVCSLMGCGWTKQDQQVQLTDAYVDELSSDSKEVGMQGHNVKQQLKCFTESEETAQTIAEQYGITLLYYDERKQEAVFYTEENVDELIRKGIEQGYAELSHYLDATIS